MIEKNVNESQNDNRYSGTSDKQLNITAERDSGTLPKTIRHDSNPADNKHAMMIKLFNKHNI